MPSHRQYDECDAKVLSQTRALEVEGCVLLGVSDGAFVKWHDTGMESFGGFFFFPIVSFVVFFRTRNRQGAEARKGRIGRGNRGKSVLLWEAWKEMVDAANCPNYTNSHVSAEGERG